MMNEVMQITKHDILLRDVLKFEQGRIKLMQEERMFLQKKVFTKWINSFLERVGMKVEDLYLDMRDGRMLLKLIEIISGEKLGKAHTGTLKVLWSENINKSLDYLSNKIQPINNDKNENGDANAAKYALLQWCQRRTSGYAGVKVVNLTGSWRNGLAFSALLHSHRPDLINYEALQPRQHRQNLNNAFDVANAYLGVPRILDAEGALTIIMFSLHKIHGPKRSPGSGYRSELVPDVPPSSAMESKSQEPTAFDLKAVDKLDYDVPSFASMMSTGQIPMKIL
uniref:Calponin-homology (CH) domain-containing protein n=1 Tax=Timema tahoe TaxID=61484 RepID=A0A7R9P0T7_9NEOP|nr:unnamed protein product [Timema tahoe]